jgi:hypothetical protein
MTTDSMNQTAIHIAQMAFDDDQNPFSLQMHFQYMDEADLRRLLNWSDNETKWKPKEYPEGRGHYRLVAECMLRYYYNHYESNTDKMKWEDIQDEAEGEAKGEPDYVVGEKFRSEKEYWSNIVIDTEPLAKV